MAKKLPGMKYVVHGSINPTKHLARLTIVEEQQVKDNKGKVLIARALGTDLPCGYVAVFSDQEAMYRSLKRNDGSVFEVSFIKPGFNYGTYYRNLGDGVRATLVATVGSLEVKISKSRLEQVLYIVKHNPDILD